MGERNSYCGGFPNLELSRQLLSRNKPVIQPIDVNAVTQGPNGHKKKIHNVEQSATPNRPREGFLLGPWVAEQERLSRDLETTNNSKRQHALFAEHLMLSMLCTEELQLPDVSTVDQVSAGLPEGGQGPLEPYGGQNRGGCCEGSDSTGGKN
ncbi:hypothetical protein KR038_004337 [Drosophila bunnanda]|nr:hypothetical protein KR038_004337 [Drosophila bunnanda]